MTFNYRYLINKSLLNALKEILMDIQLNGIPDGQSIYISFLTKEHGIVLSDSVKQRYPEEITIVLQYQFENLMVFDKNFTVDISFNKTTEKIQVPFNAITSFFDPVLNFGFQFSLPDRSDSIKRKSDPTFKFKVNPNKEKEIETTKKEGLVIAFEKGRKK